MITITKDAAEQVRMLLEKENKPDVALRIGVKGGGCSGMSYFMGLDEASPKEHDEVFEQEGIKVLVDAKSHLYLNGMTLGFRKDNLMGGGFEFQNPNAKKSCGCGSSFTA